MKRIFIFFSLFLALILANIASPAYATEASGVTNGQTGFYGEYKPKTPPSKLPSTGGGASSKPAGRLPQTGDNDYSQYVGVGVILLSSALSLMIYLKKNEGAL